MLLLLLLVVAIQVTIAVTAPVASHALQLSDESEVADAELQSALDDADQLLTKVLNSRHTLHIEHIHTSRVTRLRCVTSCSFSAMRVRAWKMAL